MGKIKDLTGKQFGRLTVIKQADDRISPSNKRIIRWLCQCECGNFKIIDGANLSRGSTQSCGCLHREISSAIHFENLIGQKYGRLTVLQKDDTAINSSETKWICLCECGNLCSVTTSLLKRGHTKSCGCYLAELRQNFRNLIDNSKTRFQDLTGQKFGKLTVIELYKDHNQTNQIYRTKWKCKCDCGNEVIVLAGHLKNGTTKSCGCMKSSGELFTSKYLQNHNITFESQKTFNDLLGIGNRKLSYDFYLPDYNMLIECQGKQHAQPIEYFGGEKKFKIQQEHDKRKREYANNNGYRLLEINYKDYDNIDKIMDKYFNN